MNMPRRRNPGRAGRSWAARPSEFSRQREIALDLRALVAQRIAFLQPGGHVVERVRERAEFIAAAGVDRFIELTGRDALRTFDQLLNRPGDPPRDPLAGEHRHTAGDQRAEQDLLLQRAQRGEGLIERAGEDQLSAIRFGGTQVERLAEVVARRRCRTRSIRSW